MQITQKLITSLKPKEKPFEVRDDKIKGFLLRVQPSGAKSYICEYRRGKRITIGKANILTLTQARNKAVEILGQVASGVDPATERKRNKTRSLSDFLKNHYGPWAEQNQRQSTSTVQRVRACFPDLLEKKLSDITAWQMEKYKTRRKKDGRVASTVNRDIVALKSVLSRAVSWGFIGENPLADFKIKKIDDNAVIRYLSVDEEKRLLDALGKRDQRIKTGRQSGNRWREERGYELKPNMPGSDFTDHLKPMVIISIHTGVRKGELFSLEWRHVDFEKSFITIIGQKAKSKQTRHIPLNKTAMDALMQWQKISPKSNYVFPGKDGAKKNSVRKAWMGVLQGAGIDSFRWHDLRHTFASKLVMAGIDLNTVRELMGHSDIKMTLRYAHLAPEHKAAAVKVLEV